MKSPDWFLSPSPQYRPSLAWFWNHSLDETVLVRQVAEFERQGYGTIAVQAGAGLTEPFEGGAWNAAVERCRQEAERLGMELRASPLSAEAFGPWEKRVTRLDSRRQRETQGTVSPSDGVADTIRLVAFPGALGGCLYDPWNAQRMAEVQLARGIHPPGPQWVYESLEGWRKEGAPPLHGRQQPWYSCQSSLNLRITRLTSALAQGERVEGTEVSDARTLWTQHRSLHDGSLFFVANVSDESLPCVRLCLPAAEGEERGWTVSRGDPDDGSWVEIPSAESGSSGVESAGIEVALDFAPWESALLRVTPCDEEVREPTRTPRVSELAASLELPSEFLAYPEGPNTLPLPDWRLQMSLIQEDTSGCALERRTYSSTFEVRDLPSRLVLVMDGLAALCKAQRSPSPWFEVRLNGEAVNVLSEEDVEQSALWPERTTRLAELTPLVQYGENRIELAGWNVALRMEQTPLLAGDFALRSIDGKWVLEGPGSRLGLGSWTEQGYPFFSGTMNYRCSVDIPETFRNRLVELYLEELAGAARISVDGTEVGTILAPPYRLTVPALQQPGSHTIQIAVMNTLTNRCLADLRPSGLVDAVRLLAR